MSVKEDAMGKTIRTTLDLGDPPPLTEAERETLRRVDAMPEEAIDYSEIPELDAAFWARAEQARPDRTEQVTLRIKKSVLDAFKAGGRGYQTRINAVLESYVRATQSPDRER